MGNFRQGGNSFGGNRGRGGFGDRGGKPPFKSWNKGGSNTRTEMHEATCHKCGKNCEVPFRPTQGKPIFCRDCFTGGQDRDARPNFAPRFEKRESSSQDNGGVVKALESISTKLDRLTVLFEELLAVSDEEIAESNDVVVSEETKIPEKKNVKPKAKGKTSKKTSK